MPKGMSIFSKVFYIFYIIIFVIGLTMLLHQNGIGKHLKVGKLLKSQQKAIL